MSYILYTTHVLTCIFLILVVLLQQGKGADLSVFGGGGTMTAFGARGAASLLHKLTVGGFVLYILLTLTIGVYQSRSEDTVMSGVSGGDEAAVAATAEDATEEDAAATTEEDAGALPEDDAGILPEAEEFEPALPEAEEPALSPVTGDEEGESPPPPDGGGG